MAKWGKTHGTLFASDVDFYEDGEDITYYFPRVRYTYYVDGKRYTGEDAYRYPCGNSNRKEVEKVVAKYPVGATVDVRYRLENPSQAYFINNLNKDIVSLMLSLSLITFAVLIFLDYIS